MLNNHICLTTRLYGNMLVIHAFSLTKGDTVQYKKQPGMICSLYWADHVFQISTPFIIGYNYIWYCLAIYFPIYMNKCKFISVFKVHSFVLCHIFSDFYLQLKCIMEHLTGLQSMLASYSHTYIATSAGQLTPHITAQNYV